MKTIHSLLTVSLLASPLVGCDALLDKDDELRTSEDNLDTDPNEDPNDDPNEPQDANERPDPQAVHAFAIRHGDLPELDVGGDTGGSGGDPGSEIDPDSLLVVVTNGAATCKEPFAANECGTRWSVSFTLAPEQQQPGTYSLWDDLNGGFSVTGEPYPEGDCSWGGGSLEGMIDIFEVDGNVVRGEIYDAQAFDFDANMTFDAASCE
ncbi:MAG: hypothetical protein AAGF11_23585 [Myxococcota bacterium]